MAAVLKTANTQVFMGSNPIPSATQHHPRIAHHTLTRYTLQNTLARREDRMLQQKRVDTGTVVLNYVEGPESGPPLILLHGLSSRWQTWLPLMPGLALNWHVYAVDLRGHGGSGRVPGHYRFTEYVDDIVAFLDARVSGPAVLFGHSLGAMTALGAGGRSPAKTKALVLEDPPLRVVWAPGHPPSDNRFAVWHRIITAHHSQEAILAELKKTPSEDDPALVTFRSRSLSQLDPDTLSVVIQGRSGDGYDLDGALSNIRCPVLLLQGNPTLGGALNDEDAGRAVSALKRCVHVRIPNIGHQIPTTDPVGTIQTVHNFLESF